MRTNPLSSSATGICVRIIAALGLALASGQVAAQEASGSYQGTVTEACLMFLNPGYLNPARGQGVIGIMANPAALSAVRGRQVGLAFGLPQRSEGSFTVRVSDSSLVYGAVDVHASLALKEMGGLAAIGFAQQYRRWRFGVALYQPRRGGLSLEAGGSFRLDTHFDVDTPITRQMVPDLPVEEIPVRWHVHTTVDASFAGGPAELSLAALPVVAAVSYTRRPLTVGVGLTYYRLRSNNPPASFLSHMSARGEVTGTPGGIDPLTNQPWWGTLQGTFSVQDDPLRAQYKIDLKGDRFAGSLGALVALGPLSLGVTYTRGFPCTLQGEYLLTTWRSSGPPADKRLPQVSLSWANRPQLTGNATLELANFQKDSLAYRSEGGLRLRGYHSVAAGLHLFVLGVFGGLEAAQDYPDLTSAYVGAYLDIPLPWLPVRLNAGVLQRADALQTDRDYFAPFRVVSHVGAGAAFRLPLARWLSLGDQPAWLRLGVRSSLTSVALKLFTERTNTPQDRVLPALNETLALGMGVDFPF
ncbi:MAG: hypothetical protein ONB14_10580 [candidate division KSB1 bacterium]|nr:hypothetical protein [candidate division KSB1 bacterium]